MFLRFFPLLYNRVKEFDNPVWLLVLTLRQIVEIICSPHLSEIDVLFSKTLIEFYIESHSQLFPSIPLHPKHHFILHYPGLNLVLLFLFGLCDFKQAFLL